MPIGNDVKVASDPPKESAASRKASALKGHREEGYGKGYRVIDSIRHCGAQRTKLSRARPLELGRTHRDPGRRAAAKC